MKLYQLMMCAALSCSSLYMGAQGSKLHTAAAQGNIAELKKLIKTGENVNSRDQSGMTPLLYAALYGRIEEMDELIKAGADVNAIEAGTGNTVLIHAVLAEKNAPAAVDLLAHTKGISFTAKNKAGLTAFQMARKVGKAGIVEILKAAGGETGEMYEEFMATFKSQQEAQQIIMSIGSNKLSELQELIKAGKNVNSYNVLGKTPLITAAEFGNMEAIDELIKAGANINAPDTETSSTPLMFAVKATTKPAATVKRLVQIKGIDLKAKNKAGLTAYQIALNAGNPEIAEILFDAGGAPEEITAKRKADREKKAPFIKFAEQTISQLADLRSKITTKALGSVCGSLGSPKPALTNSLEEARQHMLAAKSFVESTKNDYQSAAASIVKAAESLQPIAQGKTCDKAGKLQKPYQDLLVPISNNIKAATEELAQLSML